MKTVALTPSSRPAQATACPWLPALAASTPVARSASPRVISLLTAPRTLNEPVRWRFSAFRHTVRPTRRESALLVWTGVTRAWPAMRSRAASMSARVGRSNSKHLLEDLTNSRQRVEAARLHVVEQPAQLRIVEYGQLEMAARASGGNLEDLARKVRTAPTLELTVDLEPRAMLGDLLPQRLDALTTHRLGEPARGAPALMRPEREHLAHLVQHRFRQRVIHLVDRDHVRNLHDPRLQRLDRVAGAGHQCEH